MAAGYSITVRARQWRRAASMGRHHVRVSLPSALGVAEGAAEMAVHWLRSVEDSSSHAVEPGRERRLTSMQGPLVPVVRRETGRAAS